MAKSMLVAFCLLFASACQFSQISILDGGALPPSKEVVKPDVLAEIGSDFIKNSLDKHDYAIDVFALASISVNEFSDCPDCLKIALFEVRADTLKLKASIEVTHSVNVMNAAKPPVKAMAVTKKKTVIEATLKCQQGAWAFDYKVPPTAKTLQKVLREFCVKGRDRQQSLRMAMVSEFTLGEIETLSKTVVTIGGPSGFCKAKMIAKDTIKSDCDIDQQVRVDVDLPVAIAPQLKNYDLSVKYQGVEIEGYTAKAGKLMMALNDWKGVIVIMGPGQAPQVEFRGTNGRLVGKNCEVADKSDCRSIVKLVKPLHITPVVWKEKSCLQLDDKSCEDLAKLAEKNDDSHNYRKYMGAACKADPNACRSYGELLFKAKMWPEAAVAFERGCGESASSRTQSCLQSIDAHAKGKPEGVKGVLRYNCLTSIFMCTDFLERAASLGHCNDVKEVVKACREGRNKRQCALDEPARFGKGERALAACLAS